ncbi:MAG: hypothetical protein WDZ49_06145 [Litorilinea sp.]
MAFYLTLSLWRDISLIWISLLYLIGLIIPLALAYLAVRGMDAALNKATVGMRKAQHFSHQTRIQTEKISDRITRPVVSVNRKVARWQQIGRALGISGSNKRSV